MGLTATELNKLFTRLDRIHKLLDCVYSQNDIIVNSVDEEITDDYTIPEGFISASIFAPSGASVDINGVTYADGEVLNLPPLSGFGRYPIYQLTNITDTIRINYQY